MLGLPDGFVACLFDLDGVLTSTAVLHKAAWKQTFDPVLREHEGERFQEFTDRDYADYVDGRPRADGVRTFLVARGIVLPEGGPDDPPETETVWGVGNRKNELLQRVIAEQGVEPYPGSVRYLHAARDAGLATAVVTSSANASAVLEATGLADFAQALVDGNVIAEQGLAGKPAPDSFLAAARLLGTRAEATAVFEDALAGVTAGQTGGFGYVVGVNRADYAGHAAQLRAHGADVVVDDLAELLEVSA